MQFSCVNYKLIKFNLRAKIASLFFKFSDSQLYILVFVCDTYFILPSIKIIIINHKTQESVQICDQSYITNCYECVNN